MMMMVMIIIIMGHECIWKAIGGNKQDSGKGKERILKGEEYGSMLHVRTAQ
jgi:hypothetical protein